MSSKQHSDDILANGWPLARPLSFLCRPADASRDYSQLLLSGQFRPRTWLPAPHRSLILQITCNTNKISAHRNFKQLHQQKEIKTFRQYGHKIFREQSNKVMRQIASCKQQSLSGHSLEISSPCGLPPSMSASKHHSELPPPFLPDPNLCQIVSRHLLSTSLQVRMHSSWTPALDA